MKKGICLVLLLCVLVEQNVAQVKKPISSVGHAIQVSLNLIKIPKFILEPIMVIIRF